MIKETQSGEFARKKFVLTQAEKRKLTKILEERDVRKLSFEFPQEVLDWLAPKRILELVDDMKRERVFVHMSKRVKLRPVLFIGEEGSKLAETELDKPVIEAGVIGPEDRLLIECFFADKGHGIVLLGSYQDRPEFRKKGVGQEFFTRLFNLLKISGFNYVIGEVNKGNIGFFTKMGMKQVAKIKDTRAKKRLLTAGGIGEEEKEYLLYKKL